MYMSMLPRLSPFGSPAVPARPKKKSSIGLGVRHLRAGKKRSIGLGVVPLPWEPSKKPERRRTKKQKQKTETNQKRINSHSKNIRKNNYKKKGRSPDGTAPAAQAFVATGTRPVVSRRAAARRRRAAGQFRNILFLKKNYLKSRDLFYTTVNRPAEK